RGRDILIGGAGADKLYGNGGGSPPNARRTDFDAHPPAPGAPPAAGGSTTPHYMTRLQHPMGTPARGPNRPHPPAAAAGPPSPAPGGMTWYIYNPRGTAKDKIFNKRSGEVATGL